MTRPQQTDIAHRMTQTRAQIEYKQPKRRRPLPNPTVFDEDPDNHIEKTRTKEIGIKHPANLHAQPTFLVAIVLKYGKIQIMLRNIASRRNHGIFRVAKY